MKVTKIIEKDWVCSVVNCTNKGIARGWCEQHYRRWKRNGDVSIVKREQHRLGNSSEYATWSVMKDRCNNKNNKDYKNYGGRGIKVCNMWQDSFTAFYKDMGVRPKNYLLERIDNNGGYEPSNCIWADRRSQNLNQRLRKDNKAGHVGVGWKKESNKWVAYIRNNNTQYHLGVFDDKEEASIAYEIAAIQLHDLQAKLAHLKENV